MTRRVTHKFLVGEWKERELGTQYDGAISLVNADGVLVWVPRFTEFLKDIVPDAGTVLRELKNDAVFRIGTERNVWYWNVSKQEATHSTGITSPAHYFEGYKSITIEWENKR